MQFKTTVREECRVTVEVNGWIVQESADELKAECDALLSDGKTVELDLLEVTFVDAVGAAALRDLCRNGATVVGAQPFILAFIGGECRE